MTSLYDPKFLDNLKKIKENKAGADYVENELRRMKDMEDGISIYDLNQVGRIKKIFKEAEEKFGLDLKF